MSAKTEQNLVLFPFSSCKRNSQLLDFSRLQVDLRAALESRTGVNILYLIKLTLSSKFTSN